MPDIFLSYNREDQAVAQRFAQGFARAGLDVWWDTTLRAGDAYDEVTENALRTARAVVVLWSTRSVVSRWVRAEATIAARNKTLVPCMIERCERPIMFELTQTTDLVHWQGNDDDPAWRGFVTDVARFIASGGAPAPVAAVPAAAPAAAAPPAAPKPARAAEQERRHLTVLACRLADAGRLASDLDPEEWHAITTGFHAATLPILERFGGTPRWRGDELTAIFGYPVAHEDAAERAVRAGLDILAAAAAAGHHAIAAVHAGTVLVAPGADGEVQLFGDVPDLAVAARGAAPANTLLVTPAVHGRIAAAFATEAHPGPSPLFRVSGASARAAPVRSGTRFVGREDEQLLLSSRWRRVDDGDGQFLLIKGEPGIGKTRLVEAFRARIADTPHRWIDWTGASLFSNSPFHAIIQPLTRAIADRGGDRYAALEAILTASATTGDTVPLIAEMLGLPAPANAIPLSLSPAEQRRRLLDAMAEWLFALTGTAPVVIAIDDLQWVDPSTLELVQILVEQGATAPMMIIGTARPEFRPAWPERGHHATINLGRLSARDIRTLVAEASAGLDEAVIETVMNRADGVPLFAEELARLLAESGAVADIPATLRDSLAARLDRLGPAKEVAQFAAVLGREFSWELLKGVTGNDDSALADSLAALADAELIYARGTPPRATYQFKHALVQDSAYEALTRGRRKTLHNHAATIITTQFPTLAQESPELLASHWSRAGETKHAVKAWRAAGDAAYARRAFKEAEAHYREALAVLETSPDSPERDQSELDLYSALNRVMQLTLGYAAPDTIAAATKARALAEKRGSLAHLIREEARIWRAIITTGDYAAAKALADHIFDLCQREGANPARMIFAYNAQVQTRFYTGDLAGVETAFAALAPLIASVGDKQAPGNNIVAIGIGSLAAATRGDAATAAARIADAHAFAVRTGNPYDLAMALHFNANLAVLLGDVADAEAIARRLLALADSQGFSYLASLAKGPIGWAEAMTGRREGLATMRAAIDDMARTGARIAMVNSLNRLVEGQMALGDQDAAMVTIAEALAANPQEAIYRPLALTLRSRLRAAVGNEVGAATDRSEAIALADAMGAAVYRAAATAG